jgi:hypothetical protein
VPSKLADEEGQAMHDKFLILLIEDDLEASQDFKDEVEKPLDSPVMVVAPPTDMLELARLITTHLPDAPDAVIIDQLLQEYSDVTYIGIDAFEFLQNPFPSLPLYVLTDTPPGPELKELPTGNLIRTGDFLEHEAFREAFLQEFLMLTLSKPNQIGSSVI